MSTRQAPHAEMMLKRVLGAVFGLCKALVKVSMRSLAAKSVANTWFFLELRFRRHASYTLKGDGPIRRITCEGDDLETLTRASKAARHEHKF